MTTRQPSARLRWPAALVLTAMLAGSVAIYVYVEHDRSATLLAWGALCAAVLAFLKPIVVGPALALLLVASAAGCGASTSTRAAYALEQGRCIANERSVIDREGTSYEDDQRALQEERARCDAALRAIEGSE